MYTGYADAFEDIIAEPGTPILADMVDRLVVASSLSLSPISSLLLEVEAS